MLCLLLLCLGGKQTSLLRRNSFIDLSWSDRWLGRSRCPWTQRANHGRVWTDFETRFSSRKNRQTWLLDEEDCYINIILLTFGRRMDDDHDDRLWTAFCTGSATKCWGDFCCAENVGTESWVNLLDYFRIIWMYGRFISFASNFASGLFCVGVARFSNG